MAEADYGTDQPFGESFTPNNLQFIDMKTWCG